MSYYEVLGVPSNASKEEIKRAYRRLAKTHHPDSSCAGGEAGGQSGAIDVESFRQAQEAYETLCDDAARRRYDRSMQAGHSAGHASGRSAGRTGGAGDGPGWSHSGGTGRGPVWEEPVSRPFGFEDGRFGGFESFDSLFKRFLSGLRGAAPHRAAFDLVLSRPEAAEGVTVPLDMAELFPGAGGRGEVRIEVPGNRRDGEILTTTIDRGGGPSLEVELRVCVRD